MIGSGNNNYELFFKRIVVIVVFEILTFMALYLSDFFTYKLHKKDYVLVKGTVEDTLRRDGYGFSNSSYYTIIKVTEFDGTVYKVIASRRVQDKIGETVIIAINPSDDEKIIWGHKGKRGVWTEEKAISGVWTRVFCPYDFIDMDWICFVLILVMGIDRARKWKPKIR